MAELSPLMIALMMMRDKKEDDKEDIGDIFRTEIRGLKKALMEKLDTPGKTYFLGGGGDNG